MSNENDKKIKSQLLELMHEVTDVIILGMMSFGPEKWVHATEEDNAPYTTVDIKLPSAEARTLIYDYLEFLESSTTRTQGQIESYLFGRLIAKGLVEEAKEANVYKKGEIARRMMEKLKRANEIAANLQNQKQ